MNRKPPDTARLAEARAHAREARAKSPLRRNFADNETWMELAKQRGMQLPMWGTPATPRKMRQWLNRLDKNLAWYREVTGFTTLQEWADHNPTWPFRAFAGVMLEHVEGEDGDF